ncbi:60S ribosomal protein L29 [Ixodes scapularis]
MFTLFPRKWIEFPARRPLVLSFRSGTRVRHERSRESNDEAMAKTKNHTNHNQNRKDHRNGIKRPKKGCHLSMRGVDPKFLKNLRFSRKHNRKGLKKMRANEAAQLQAKVAAAAATAST